MLFEIQIKVAVLCISYFAACNKISLIEVYVELVIEVTILKFPKLRGFFIGDILNAVFYSDLYNIL